MKHLKMLGLLAVAAAAMMAFAGIASATTLTSSSAGAIYTSTIKASSEGTTSLHGPFTTVSCTGSTVEGKVESHGAAVTAAGKISSLTFTGCNFPVKVLKPGSLEIHTQTTGVVNGNGTLTSTGAEITIETSLANCLFTTNGTDIGLLTGSKNLAGKTATLDINSAGIPRTGHSFFCGSSGTWTGSYSVTTPDYLDVD